MRRAALLPLAFLAMLALALGAMTHWAGPMAHAPMVDEHAPAAITRTEPGQLVLPVAHARWQDVADSWGDAREGGARGHQGTDIMAPQGTPVIAAAAGQVEKLFTSAAGGLTLYVRSADRRWTYYYAHLAGYAAGIAEGRAVQAGDPIGYVGDTGNAGAGNYHLHFGISRMRADDGWWQGTPVDPYPLLARGRAGR